MFEELLRQRMRETVIKTTAEAKKYFEKYENHKSDLKVGDYVVLNEMGKNKYSSDDRIKLRKIVRLFDEYQYDNEENAYNAQVAIVFSDGDIRFFTVDTKLLEKEKQPKTVLKMFRKDSE